MKYLIFLLLTACGPFKPTIDVNANVNGHVNTSGTITIQYDLNSLTTFFQTQCENQLGSGATQDQINQCATNELDAFLNTFGTNNGNS